MEWVMNATPRPRYPGKEPVLIGQEAWWATGPVWMSAECLVPTGVRIANRAARR